jgi:hypothetical protein
MEGKKNELTFKKTLNDNLISNVNIHFIFEDV